jgi:hypothetical protein
MHGLNWPLESVNKKTHLTSLTSFAAAFALRLAVWAGGVEYSELTISVFHRIDASCKDVCSALDETTSRVQNQIGSNMRSACQPKNNLERMKRIENVEDREPR